MSLVPIILCGGAGSRLWPVSREMHPKPFIRLSDGQSLLQKAFLRGAGLADVSHIITVTNRDLFFKTRDELYDVVDDGIFASFILEPTGRNTAAAIAAAALYAIETEPQATLLVLAADHLITDQHAFANAVERACALAAEGTLVTFGIQPKSPETGYGYIEADGNKVLHFVEKPDADTAASYVASGRFLWNSGMFCFRAATVLKEMLTYCPEILQGVQASLASSRRARGQSLAQCELDEQPFARLPDISFDYAVMEKSRRVAVVPCEIGWSDIGSWNAVGELSQADDAGNRIEGSALLYNANNCFVHSKDRLVAALGVDNLVIVDTPDAVLVANRQSVQDVRHLYDCLKDSGHDSYKFHRTVHRPWGTYTVVEEGHHFKIKRLVIKPRASLSLQLHHHRSEHWVVLSGIAHVVKGSQQLQLATNESTYIPSGMRHKLSNPDMLPLVMIEVQSGAYLGEDDIVRFDDHYDREPEPDIM